MEQKKRVLLGMSGGTDSSVAAMLLQDAGYEVVGVTFRFFELNDSTEYLEDARILASRLGIRHITYDARKIFHERIVTYFIDEYLAGHTPVPCTLCNNYLKWPLLAMLADEMGVFYISTGHYVRKIWMDEKYYITPAAGSQEKGTEYYEKHSEYNRHCYSCSRIIRRLDRMRRHRLALCVLMEHSGYCGRSDHVHSRCLYGRWISLIYFLEARASCSGFQNISTRSRLLPTLPSFQPRIKPLSFQ